MCFHLYVRNFTILLREIKKVRTFQFSHFATKIEKKKRNLLEKCSSVPRFGGYTATFMQK